MARARRMQIRFECAALIRRFRLLLLPVLLAVVAVEAQQWTTFTGTGDDAPNNMVYQPATNLLLLTGGTKAAWPLSSTPFAGVQDLSLFAVDAHTGTVEWARLDGGTGDDVGYGLAIGGLSGSIYVTGFTKSAVFNGASGAVFGDNDLVTLKYADDGQSITWMRFEGGAGSDQSYRVALDTAENVYITGSTESSALNGQPMIAAHDLFVIKYDKDGVRQWTRRYGGTFASTTFVTGYGLVVDSASNVLVVAPASGSIFNLTYAGGLFDVLVLKLSPAGNYIWAQLNGGAGSDFPFQAAIDASDALFIGGYTTASINGAVYHGGAADYLVMKYDTTGVRLWTRLFGGTGADTGKRLAVDPFGDALITGYSDSAFDGQTFNGGSNDFVTIKVASNGTRLWTQFTGGSGSDQAFGITTNSYGRPFVAGFSSAAWDGATFVGPTLDYVIASRFCYRFTLGQYCPAPYGNSPCDEASECAVPPQPCPASHYCGVGTSPASPMPCSAFFHAAVCTATTLNCTVGWSGELCDTFLTECSSQPCQNGGSCVPGFGLFECSCGAAFTGSLCQTRVNPCASLPCPGASACTDQMDGTYACTCAPGTTGVGCVTDIDECASSPCRNGGTCHDERDSFACTCRGGFSGTVCQFNIDECASNPCLAGGICDDQINGFSCRCVDGRSGVRCQTDVNECASHPCANGGVCADASAGFTCDCSAIGFVGATCDTPRGACPPSACANGGVCVPNMQSFTCDCPVGYTGATCAIPPRPTARFTAPTTVSACDSLLLDASTSVNPSTDAQGSALLYYWGISSFGGSALTPNIRSFGATPLPSDGKFGTFASADERQIAFASFELSVGANYNFTLSVVSTGTELASTLYWAVITKQSAPTPVVTVSFPTALAASDSVTIRPALTPSVCALAGTAYEFQWSVSPPLPPTVPVGTPAINYASRSFYLPSHVARVDTAYVFTVTIHVVLPPDQIQNAPPPIVIASAPIIVAPSPLVLIVSGGSRTVSVDQPLVLDGSASYDPDSANAVLDYAWSCRNETGELFVAPGSSSAAWPASITSTSTSRLQLPAYAMVVGRVYTFQLCLNSTSLRAVCSSLIAVTAAAVPDFPNPTVLILGAGSITVNPGADVRFNSQVYSSASTQFLYEWTDTTGRLSSYELESPDTIASTPAAPNVVIRGSKLTPGTNYVFRLTATASNIPVGASGGRGYAEVAVTVTVPPSSGSCSAIPAAASTSANSNSYTLSCWDWQSTYPPLSYAFLWYSATATPAATPLTPLQASSVAVTSLPFGALTVVAQISDSRGAQTLVPMPVNTPWPPAAAANPIEFAANLTASVDAQLAAQDTSRALATLAVVTQLINTASAATPSAGQQPADTAPIRDYIISLLNHVSTNLTIADGSTATTIVAVLSQATSVPADITPEAYTDSLQTIQNVLSTLTSIALSSASNTGAGGAAASPDSSRTSVVTQATQIASNFLNIANCSLAFSSVQQLMADILRLQQIGRVAGESATAIDTNSITAIVARTTHAAEASTGSTSSTLNSTAVVELPPLSTSLAALFAASNTSIGATYDVSIVNYNNVSSCLANRARTGNGTNAPLSSLNACGELVVTESAANSVPEFASGITTAQITDSSGTVQTVANLPSAQAINFTIPVAPGTGADVRCTWWNELTHAWDTSGCLTIYNPNTPNQVLCSCTHLTDFAVLLNERESRAGISDGTTCNDVRLTQSSSFRVFVALYGALALVTVVPLVRQIRSRGFVWSLSVGCHLLIVVICLSRLATLLAYVFAADISLTTVAILAATPYVFVYWLHTFVIFAWAGIHHYATASFGENPFTKVRPYFIALNLAVVATSVTLFGLVAFSPAATPISQLQAYSDAGSFLIGTLSLATGSAFIAYGYALTRGLTQDFASKHATRIFRVAAICSVAFIGESAIVIYSAAQPHEFNAHFGALNSLYLSFDVACMCAVLILFQSHDSSADKHDDVKSINTRTYDTVRKRDGTKSGALSSNKPASRAVVLVSVQGSSGGAGGGSTANDTASPKAAAGGKYLFPPTSKGANNSNNGNSRVAEASVSAQANADTTTVVIPPPPSNRDGAAPRTGPLSRHTVVETGADADALPGSVPIVTAATTVHVTVTTKPVTASPTISAASSVGAHANVISRSTTGSAQ